MKQRGALHLAESEQWLSAQRDTRKHTLSEAELSRWTWLDKGKHAQFIAFYAGLPRLLRRVAA